jgi:pimeloyl-ACP methyl ester carboxylesterase
MSTVTSSDGTAIAYERTGSGPPIVLVDGAMCDRAGGPMRPLAQILRDSFTVYAYDRRGRGDSSDTPPYAVEREVEDLQALIGVAGGEAGVYAVSSGGALAIAAAAVEPGITRIALFEPPYLAEVGDDAPLKAYTKDLDELLAAGRRGDAVARFMAHVGVPEQVVAGMRSGPGWSAMEAIAPTLAYDDALLGGGRVPREAADVTIPALVMSGGDCPQALQQAAKAAAQALPAAEFRILPGQTHDVAPTAVGPVLVEFFGAA